MFEPERFLKRKGPAARLLRSAELDVPGDRSRQRAIAAAAGAVATLAAGTSVAMSGAALAKSVGIWLCVGALGGTTVATAVTYFAGEGRARSQPAERRVELAPDVFQVPRPASTPTGAVSAAEPALPEMPAARAPATPSARFSTAEAAPTAEPGAGTGPSVASFADAGPRQGLFDEVKWLEAARSAAARADYSAVLSTLDRYQSGFPAGSFRPEAMALRIEALSRLGDRERAGALAERFRRDYPAHPLLARVRAALER